MRDVNFGRQTANMCGIVDRNEICLKEKRIIMRKLFLILLSVMMIFAFVGCEESVSSNNGNNVESVSDVETFATSINTPGSTSELQENEVNTNKSDSTTESGLTETSPPTATASIALPPISTKVGDVIKYGKYEQDNNTSNGKEDIEWIVLEKENNRILVTSKYALDRQRYNETCTNVTWENCTLRTWLNSTFINDAFSSNEMSKIPTVTVIAEKNPEFETAVGSDTQDRVFLLSVSEANKYFTSYSLRQCEPTAYTVANGADVYGDNGKCWWWLRTPGARNTFAVEILYSGDVFAYGAVVSEDYYAVRPALWIDLNS